MRNPMEDEADATRAMMANDSLWPNLVLPVKNRKLPGDPGGWPKLGYMTQPCGPDGVRIIIGNVIMRTGTEAPMHYATIDDAMAAGWRVD